MTSFFSDHAEEVTFPGNRSDASTQFRTCQEGAYWAIKSYRTTQRDEPAIISLPTGGGKTALMMLAAFEFTVDRALIVAPSEAVRNQISDKFERLEGLKKANVLSSDIDAPEVGIHKSRLTSKSNWKEYEDTDIVVTTPNSVSEKFATNDEEPTAQPPDGFFDLLMIDEAHHSAAPGWKQILNNFTEVPQLLFTATPFRREEDTLPGELIYHYPIEEACKAGIYHKVGLRTIPEQNRDLVNEAAEQLTTLQESNAEATLLARTDGIEEADSLAKTYREQTDLEIQAIHSDADNNQDTIDDLRDGEIDGVVVVQKLAEGLDVPNLQLAVFHVPPKSFRMMLQIIGRLAREPDDEMPATILTTDTTLTSKGMSEAVRQLYREDTGWASVADELISEHIKNNSTDKIGGATPLEAVNPDNIRPYKTATVYSLAETVFEPLVDDADDVVVETDADFGHVLSTPESVWGCITTTQESPTWGTNTILESPTYNLHLYCSPADSELLFEYTSDARRANTIRTALLRDHTALTQIDGKRLSKAMQSLTAPKYKAAGMNNVLVPSGTQPEHKLLTGGDVQGAVYHSDKRRYTHGHVFASFEPDVEDGDSRFSESSNTKTRGISTARASIWSNSKAGLSVFETWCETLADELTADGEPTIRNLGIGNHGEAIDEFETSPFAVMPFPSLTTAKVERQTPDDDSWHTVRIDLELDDPENPPMQTVDVCMTFENFGTCIECSYDVAANEWSGDITDYRFRLPEETEYSILCGDELLKEFPPIFHTDANTTVMSGAQSSAETDLADFDPATLKASIQPNWPEYIEVDATEKPEWWETDEERDKDISELWDERPTETVFPALVDFLKDQRGDEQYALFCDDMGDEIADFIEFRKEEKEINMYHCKRSKSPGVRISYFKDIYHQTLRSLRYTFSQKLIDQVEDGSGLSHFVCGKDVFEEIADDFLPGDWEYTIYGVHPGLKLDFDPEDGNENVGRLLSECVEQVERYNVDFAMMGAGGCWEESNGN
ncbi:DEAD/DEAH box helicase [Halorussus lipolyticus]|uniref:DEAD/DEAH box helicase n=1 Tax=Halorussus lipolyticus TaxID=3034024 RepID=UPI0023E867B5|nr:DEAD/DEAH box helicase family protein [Halorussus sp. DT80]